MTTLIQTASRKQADRFRAERDEAWRLASTWEQEAEDAMRALHNAAAELADLKALMSEVLSEFWPSTVYEPDGDVHAQTREASVTAETYERWLTLGKVEAL